MTPKQKEAFRREVLEEVAEWYASTGWFLDEDDVPTAIRALAAIQPAPAADTGQAVAWQRRLFGPKVKDGNWHTITQEQAVYAIRHGHPEGVPDVTCEVRPLYTHPAPLDAERVREDERDRLYSAAYYDSDPKSYDACHWLIVNDAMLPTDRAALRQKEDKA